jgi:polar amino acid transport system permease protein
MPFLHQLGSGALTTIELTVLSGLLGFAVALIAGTAMLSRFRSVRFLARTYTEAFRGASEIVVLFIFVYGTSLPTFLAAVIALALSIGGYEAEVVRGAVQAVPRGQTEAAIALNMSPLLRLRRIIVPQALVSMLPPINVLTVQLLKASALVSIATITDLTFSADKIIELNGQHVRYYGEILVGYYLIATIINQIFRLTERGLKRGRDIGGMVGG